MENSREPLFDIQEVIQQRPKLRYKDGSLVTNNQIEKAIILIITSASPKALIATFTNS